MADAQAPSPMDGDSKHAATEQDPTQLDSEKTRQEIEKLKLEIETLRQNQRPLQKIATSATAISTMVAVVAAVVSVIVSSGALRIQASTFAEDARHNERGEITSIIEKLTEKDVPIPRQMALVWALRQYWWGDNSEVLSNALGTLILYDDDPNVVQAAGLAFGRISHDNPNWPKAKRVLFGSAKDGDKGAVLRFNLELQKDPPKHSLTDERFLALGDAVRLNWADLSGVNLANANLKKCELYQANLEDADLSGAHLEGADLSGAHLQRANLSGCHLEDAKLNGANLDGANVYGVDLKALIDEKNRPLNPDKTVNKTLKEWLGSKGVAQEVIEKIRTDREPAIKNQKQ